MLGIYHWNTWLLPFVAVPLVIVSVSYAIGLTLIAIRTSKTLGPKP